MNITVDTDILIDFSLDKDKILTELFVRQSRKEVNLKINPIIIAEFLTDQNLKSNKTKEERAFQLLHYFECIDITTKEGMLAARLLREKRIPFLPDALIAASCILNDFQLATRNQKHFRKVPKLQFYSPDA